MASVSDTRSVTCPDCGSPALPIFYGDPPHQTYLTAEEHGRLVLGGNMSDENQPSWACSDSDCALRWNGPDPLRAIQRAVRQLESHESHSG